MQARRLGSIYVSEYLKILEKAAEAMERFPLLGMSAEERKAVVLSYVDLVDRFQGQLKEAGITRLLDLYDEEAERPAADENEDLNAEG